MTSKAIPSDGTKVFLRGYQVVICPPGCGYEPAADEPEIHGITAIDVKFRPDDCIRAEIVLLNILEKPPMVAQPKFYVNDPSSNKVKQVKKIEFADGTVWEAP